MEDRLNNLEKLVGEIRKVLNSQLSIRSKPVSLEIIKGIFYFLFGLTVLAFIVFVL